MDPQTCVHYTGLIDKKCAMGISYDSFTNGNHEGLYYKVPCFNDHNEDNYTCIQQRLPSSVDVLRHNIQNKGDSMYKALSAIANMQVTETTNHQELSALCIAIANIEVKKMKGELTK
jgi:hypothetical protein